MVFRGHVRNGQVVVDNGDALPEGAKLRIEVVPGERGGAGAGGGAEPLGRKLLRHAGTASGLPSDLARNHDHYLYGTPRK